MSPDVIPSISTYVVVVDMQKVLKRAWSEAREFSRRYTVMNGRREGKECKLRLEGLVDRVKGELLFVSFTLQLNEQKRHLLLSLSRSYAGGRRPAFERVLTVSRNKES